MALKNLGTVAAIYYGVTAPDNERILWYDQNTDVIRFYNVVSASWDAFTLSDGQIRLNITDPLDYLENKLHSSLEIVSGDLQIETSLLAKINGALLAANNLSDLANATTARTNLSVYSIAQINAIVGSRSYSAQNFIINGQSITASLDALDVAFNTIDNLGDVTITSVNAGDILIRSGAYWVNQRKYINPTVAQYTPNIVAGVVRLNEAYSIHDIVIAGNVTILDFQRSDGTAFPAGTVLYLTLYKSNAGTESAYVDYGGVTSNILYPLDLSGTISESILIDNSTAVSVNGMVLNIVKRQDGKWAPFSNEKLITDTFIGDLRYSMPKNLTDGDNVTICLTNLDDAIGDISNYVNNNYIADSDPLATAVSKLDLALFNTTLNKACSTGGIIRTYGVTAFSPRTEASFTGVVSFCKYVKIGRLFFINATFSFTTSSGSWLNRNEILVKLPTGSGFPTLNFTVTGGIQVFATHFSSSGPALICDGHIRNSGDYPAYQNEFVLVYPFGTFNLSTLYHVNFSAVLFTDN